MRPLAPPRLYLGTMTFAWSQTSSRVDEGVALKMVDLFAKQHQRCGDNDDDGNSKPSMLIDTARIYAGGKTEPMVGTVIAKFSGSEHGDKHTILLGTKAHPSQPGGLSPDGIKGQFQASIDAMGVKFVYEYYLHQPDTAHSLAESLECLHGMVAEGLITAIGMSNYHVSEMERAFALCEANNWTPPTVYQGLYNPLNRVVEGDLIPLLRKNGCAFVAYNPLAAGLLVGKHTDSDPTAAMKGRFKNNKNYLPRFYTPENFAAIEGIRAACEGEGISMVEATYRWLLYHSALNEKDGILIGASSLPQLEQNLLACGDGGSGSDRSTLPDSILERFEDAWKITQGGAFPYWRSYSADMPGRDGLDQGASYDAAKK